MTANRMPPAEVAVPAPLVRSLLDSQAPQLADLELSEFANGWDNMIYRLGSSHTVRLPRREVAAQLILNEQEWLPSIAPRLSQPIPVPTVFGVPEFGYPWHWSVCAWIPGEVAAEATFSQSRVAKGLATFLRELHQPAPSNAPANPYRGVPLASRDGVQRKRIAELDSELDPLVGQLWEELVGTAPWTGEPVWIHGDTHPLNLLVADGNLCGVVDFGDISSGDPASDLAAAYMLFDADHRKMFRAGFDHTEATWQRSRAWAIALGLAFLAHSADNPAMKRIASKTLSEALIG